MCFSDEVHHHELRNHDPSAWCLVLREHCTVHYECTATDDSADGDRFVLQFLGDPKFEPHTAVLTLNSSDHL
jgi:hypothetical protein